MRTNNVVTSALLTAGFTLASSTALAFEPGLDGEMAYVQRPLTLPEMTLAPVADLRLTNLSVQTPFGAVSATIYSQSLGARFGVTDDIELYATPLSFYAGEASGYGLLHAGGTFRFVGDDTVEVGASAGFFVGTGNAGGFIGIQGGLPVIFRASDMLRIDTGLMFAAPLAGDAVGDPSFALAKYPAAVAIEPSIPARFTIQAMDNFFLGLDTGFGVADVGRFGDTIFVPLGFRVGGTIPMDNRPLVDLTTGFRFPTFIQSGGGDAIFTNLWEIQLVQATAYLDLK